VISSSMSASRIFLDTSSSALCSTALQCSHILFANSHNSSMAWQDQTLLLSFFGMRSRLASTARDPNAD
jgi:hypothetical protein